MRKFEVRGLWAFILTVLLVFAPFPGGLAFADNTTTLTATADATINQASATSNYGASTTIRAAAPLTSAKQRTLVTFAGAAFNAIPAAIKAAYLKMTLTATGAPTTASTQAVHTVTSAWTEGTGTDAVPTTTDASWSNRTGTTAWTAAGGDYLATAINTQSSGTVNGALITWPVYYDGTNTNIVQLWRTGALTNNGLLIKDSTEPGIPLTATAVLTQTWASATRTSFTTTGTLPTSYSLYMAAIGKRGTVVAAISDVTSVTGGGLAWANVGRQDNTSTSNYGTVEVWYAIGTPTATTVTANFPSAAQSNAIVITRFTGFNPSSPFGTPVGAATVGGALSNAPTVNLTTTAANSFAYGAVWAGNRTATPGTGFTEDGEIGSARTTDIEVEHRLMASPVLIAVAATLSGTVAWAILAVEIKQQVAPQYNSRENAGTKPQLEVHYIADVTAPNATSTVPSEVNLGWTMPAGGIYIGTSGTLLVKRQGASATTFTPVDANSSYTAGTTTGDGTSVLYSTSFSTISFTDENGADSALAPSTQYTYKAWVRDDTTISGFGTAPYYAVGTAFTTVTTPAVGSGTTKNWSYKTAATALAPPGLNPNTGVVAVSNDNKVHSMNASTGVRNYQPSAIAGLTGAALQSRPTIIPGTESTPSRAYDVVYAGSQDGYVYAFNAASGAQLWKSALLGSAIQGSAAVQLKKYSNGSFTPTVDLVIVGTRNTGDTVNNKIYGLNGDTGATVWTATYTSLGITGVDIINSMPMIDYSNNTVWVTSRAGSGGGQPSIFQLNTPNGSKVGAVTLLSTTVKDIDASPTLNAAGTFLYVVTGGTGAGQLVAVDTATGAEYASVAVSGSLGGAGYPIPVANGGSDDVYFVTSGTSGGVYARSFDRTSHTFGTTRTWDRTDLTSVSTPVFMPPPGTLYLYVGDGAGVLHKLNPATGLDAATRTVASTTLGDPGMDLIANKLYVGGSNGRIYSFDLF